MRTDSSATPSSARRRRSTLPALVYLRALSTRFQTARRRSSRSPETHTSGRGPAHLDPVGGHPQGVAVHVGQHVVEPEGPLGRPCRRRLQPGQGQQVADQRLHPAQLGEDVAQRLHPVSPLRAPGTRARNSTLVRIAVSGVRSSWEASATKRRWESRVVLRLQVGLLQLGQHLVERQREAAELVVRVAVDRHAVGEVAFVADPLGGGPHAGQGPSSAAAGRGRGARRPAARPGRRRSGWSAAAAGTARPRPDRATVTWPSSLTICLASGRLAPGWRTALLAWNRSAYTARGRPRLLADGRTLTTWPGGRWAGRPRRGRRPGAWPRPGAARPSRVSTTM